MFFKDAFRIFGVKRSIFATNFPVDKVRVQYKDYIKIYNEILLEMGCNQNDFDDFFYNNAVKYYRLDI